MDISKILGSFACFFALNGSANIDLNTISDLNAQSVQYVQQTNIIDKKAYTKLCEDITKINLLYFILHNDIGFDSKDIDIFMPILAKVLNESQKRMQKNNADKNVYYSTLAFKSFLESKEIVGSIEIADNFDIVEYGKGVENARVTLKALNA